MSGKSTFDLRVNIKNAIIHQHYLFILGQKSYYIVIQYGQNTDFTLTQHLMKGQKGPQTKYLIISEQSNTIKDPLHLV